MSSPRRVALIALLLAAACGRERAAPSVDVSRVAVVGASMSAGFGGARVAELIDGAIAGDHEVKDLADTFLFRDPLGKGRAQIDAALAFSSTAVVALDSVFWCVYTPASEQVRARRLDQCLAELARVQVPVFVGDIPDMHRAASWMLPPDSVPPPEQLVRFNARLREWVRERSTRRLVPMARWGEQLLADPDQARRLMSFDGLHPSREGVVHLLRRMAREVDGAAGLRGL